MQLIEYDENPIRVIRKAKGLSLRAAADKIGCGHQALYMNETGAYAQPLPVVLDWLVANSDYDQLEIELAYAVFITSCRVQAGHKYGFSTADVGDLGAPGDNPVQKFREHFGLTRSAFCKQVCVPASLMYTLENPGAQHVAARIPDSLLMVFKELNVSKLVRDEMVERYGIWRDGI